MISNNVLEKTTSNYEKVPYPINRTDNNNSLYEYNNSKYEYNRMYISKTPIYKSINNNVFVYENVLSGLLIKECLSFASICINKKIYTTNHISWPDYIVDKSDIIKIIKLDHLNKCLKEKICYELQNRYNFIIDGLHLNLHIMNEGCYINDHRDNHVNYAFTIYLNDIWKSSDGGIFQFDIDDKIYNIIPKYNMMVLLQNNIHRVTKITSNVSRITIQGFYSGAFYYKKKPIDFLLYNKNEGYEMF